MSGSSNPVSRVGRGIVRFAPLLAAVAFLLLMGWLGARGQGPLGQVDAVRALGGLEPVDRSPEPERGEPTGTVPGDGEYSGLPEEAGLCATWNQTGDQADRATHRVACEDPHRFEVAAVYEIDGTPFDEDGPSDADVSGPITDACEAEVTAYLGYPLDERGRFAPTVFVPTPEGWRQRDRTIICGIIEPRLPIAGDASVVIADDGELFAGRVAGADQAPRFRAGMCFAGQSPTMAMWGVCDGPHTIEVVGRVDVVAGPDDPYPGDAAIAELGAGPCTALATEVYGGPLAPDLAVAGAALSEAAWAAGSREVACVMGRRGADGAWTRVEAPLRAATGS